MSGESFFLDWEFYWRFRVGLSKVEVLTGRICCEEVSLSNGGGLDYGGGTIKTTLPRQVIQFLQRRVLQNFASKCGLLPRVGGVNQHSSTNILSVGPPAFHPAYLKTFFTHDGWHLCSHQVSASAHSHHYQYLDICSKFLVGYVRYTQLYLLQWVHVSCFHFSWDLGVVSPLELKVT